MEREILNEKLQFTCGRCGFIWIPRRTNYKKKPNPKGCPRCQVKFNKVKPKIKIIRTEIVKKIIMV